MLSATGKIIAALAAVDKIAMTAFGKMAIVHDESNRPSVRERMMMMAMMHKMLKTTHAISAAHPYLGWCPPVGH